jgi:hypothetical protein
MGRYLAVRGGSALGRPTLGTAHAGGLFKRPDSWAPAVSHCGGRRGTQRRQPLDQVMIDGWPSSSTPRPARRDETLGSAGIARGLT